MPNYYAQHYAHRVFLVIFAPSAFLWFLYPLNFTYLPFIFSGFI